MPPQRHLPKSSEQKVRQRSSRACGPCRKRKIKCDAAFPCGACVGYGYDCVFTDTKSSTFTHWIAGAAAPTEPPVVNDSISTLPSVTIAQDKADDQYVASESFVHCPSGQPLLHQSIKTRFTSSHSAIAFPRNLGLSLGITPPRLQSFGWNPGIRQEPAMPSVESICDIITLDQLKLYSSIYFNEVHPYFGILDRDLYAARTTGFWNGQQQGSDFEACICGVVALGSLFAGKSPCPSEARVVEQARLLLDLTTAYAPSLLSMKHVVAWTLRAIYLRSTTRPHLSWLASCTSIHIAEAIGLHREFGKDRVKCDMTRDVTALEVDLRRRTFWVALALNQFLSGEYGRTRVSINSITCEPLASRQGDFTSQVVEFMQAVPKQQFLICSVAELLERLKTTAELKANSPFIGLLKADACFCIFRMLRSTNVSLSATHIASLLEVIRVALDGVQFLTAREHPWWNIVSTPFQSVCILLSLGTPESLAIVPSALEALKNVVTLYDSHLSREALSTAASLVRGARDKINKELDSLDQGLEIIGEFSPPSTDAVRGLDSGFEWLMDDTMGFAELFDNTPFYGME